jgi:CHASE3 domain sensor protein
MFLIQENLHPLPIKKNKLQFIFELFIVLLIVASVIFYQSIFLITNNVVYVSFRIA